MGEQIGLPAAVCLGNRADTPQITQASPVGEGFFEREGPRRCAIVVEMFQPLDATCRPKL